jgi:hypothetical protein
VLLDFLGAHVLLTGSTRIFNTSLSGVAIILMGDRSPRPVQLLVAWWLLTMQGLAVFALVWHCMYLAAAMRCHAEQACVWCIARIGFLTAGLLGLPWQAASYSAGHGNVIAWIPLLSAQGDPCDWHLRCMMVSGVFLLRSAPWLV